MTPEFEWDADKEAANLQKHEVSFTQAAAAFMDPFAVDWVDEREDYDEERVILLGMTDGSVLTVVYTDRDTRIRIISARRASKYEQQIYYRENAPP
jgi:uncharacterized DUF497 family protein